jgi:two-component system, LuxR family, response regulator FixJ
MTAKYMVCVVSEDAHLNNALKGSFKSAAVTLASYAKVEEVLKAIDDDKPIGCLVSDLRSGSALLAALAKEHCIVPVVLVANSGGVTAAVQAIKAGAFDVVEKPDAAVESAKSAMALYAKCKKIYEERCIATARIDSLTRREAQVLALMVDGKPNRTIAEELGISSKTLDIHRANLMAKMEARTTADMCRAFLLARTNPMHLHFICA